MQIITLILLVILFTLLVYNIYKIQTNDNIEYTKQLPKTTNYEKSEYEKSLEDLKGKLKLTKEQILLNNKDQIKEQFQPNKESNIYHEEYLSTLINAVINLDKKTFKDFRLYSNINLDYYDYDTKNKLLLKIDHILLTPYGILTIKNIALEGLAFVDLKFNLEQKSKALQVKSNTSKLKTKEFSHPLVDAIHQSKALSTYFISKNLPNAFITPIVVFTNLDDDYKNNSVLLKLENGEYTLFDSLCKINNLLGNSKNNAYMITPNYVTRFLTELKDNMDISRPIINYSTDDIYNFDLALLSLNLKNL